MDWTQFAIFIICILGMFFWNRSESRADIRHMDSKLDANRNLIAAMHHDAQARHQDTRDLIQAVQLEMKDFHGRLIAIEERRK